MFTVISNPRKSNRIFLVALAIVFVLILAIVVVPSVAAPKSAVIPVTGASGSPDYFQRHPELRSPAGIAVEMNGDFALRHPEARTPAGLQDLSDYFLRH